MSTTELKLTPRGLLHLLFNGKRAIDVVKTAYDMGMLEELEARTRTLDELCATYKVQPLRLYKFLDCLESMGLVMREQKTDALGSASYRAVEGLREAAEKVVGADSLELDRERYDWKALYEKLPTVLKGDLSIPRESFDWPPSTPAQVAGFEASMAAGLGPIIEAFRIHGPKLWGPGQRILDVGGGDGTLAAHLLKLNPKLTVDVFNIPATRELVAHTREKHELGQRLGFVSGDFLKDPLPKGYDALAFVRVLHDWPAETARHLMRSAYEALPSGGRILICEEFRTPERLTAQFFWSYFLMGVDSCVSRLREVEYYLTALQELGFNKPEVLPGPFEIIVATKP
ncbi:MAG TPA: methyltransferase [Myxococcaceae bacterium]|jgi:SAM-dependent methyltransferase/DNA-binding HxlR family transcriptional regulator